MGVSLKKFDLLVRENSRATEQQVLDYLQKVFAEIEKNNTKEHKVLGYAAVFDARVSEYYLYYSDSAKKVFNMTKNKYELIPKHLVTSDNFLTHLLNNIQYIKALILGGLKLITKKTKVESDGSIKLPDNIKGDIVLNTVEVKTDNYYEDFIVSVDKKTLVGVPPSESGKEVLFSYLATP